MFLAINVILCRKLSVLFSVHCRFFICCCLPLLSMPWFQVVVNALIQAIPAIFNVLLVCLVFWLIFSIMGVNLFMGRFNSCRDVNYDYPNSTLIKNKNDCLTYQDEYNLTWDEPMINFNSVPAGYLSLFQVVSPLCSTHSQTE